jgi:hypothetical protein
MIELYNYEKIKIKLYGTSNWKIIKYCFKNYNS